MKPTVPILTVKKLSKEFKKNSFWGQQKNSLRAVDQVDFSIEAGEFFALIGESGSGKSTLAKLLLQMEAPSSGEIIFLNQLDTPLTKRSPAEMQVIFQNPDAAMNPFMTILNIVMEPLVASDFSKEKSQAAAVEMLKKVGLAEDLFQRFPAQLSGGQKQRVVIARALVTNPKFIIADEPVSSLDVSLQAQIINLMLDLQKERALTYLFISHDLQLVAKIADRVAVMYQGKIVEIGTTQQVLENPQADYTKQLIAAQLD